MKSGLYEKVINEEIGRELAGLPEACRAAGPIDGAEASRVLAQYTSGLICAGLDNVLDRGGSLEDQIDLANEIIRVIRERTGETAYEGQEVRKPGEQLLALLAADDPELALGKSAADLTRPETPVSVSSLFTGAIHEPQMFSELKKEIRSADRIDMLVSFIKWSGLRLIIDELKAFTGHGGKLRVITTSYMGATDLKAVDELALLENTELRVSYDTNRTRLHAKAYLFFRESGFTTAYIGSSNLSNAAISSGLEWNVKATQIDLPDTIQKVEATFESYWNASEFEPYTSAERERLRKALIAERTVGEGEERRFVFDVNPYPYQQEILDRLQAEREIRGRFKNLIVAATGTGKTLISAFDYRRYREQHPGERARLLFVAHREEILKQSLEVFQGVLKDPNFGELYTGRYRPESLDHVFLSVWTADSQHLYEHIPADYYDFIIIDEFHHAAAPTYQKLLRHFQPKILLGLTATPERLDGKSILTEFDGRIAAEIRLPEAIERKLLCPFQYFGVSDTVDLNELKWARGGYDRHELSNIYTFSRQVAEKRASHIVNSVNRYLTAPEKARGIGFCVSVEHARFMAEFFNAHGLPALSLDANSPEEERSDARKRLERREIRWIFVVDLYNEGVDLPFLDTVLFLRPTESQIIFLQQLGRGLRLSEGKECLTVLDFIGAANRHYNFEEKFRALLTETGHSLQTEIKNGFVSVPKGCYIQLEKKAQKAILDNLRRSFSQKQGLLDRIESFTEESGQELTLSHFLSYYHLDLSAIYAKYSFARLRVEAGVGENFLEPAEAVLTKAFCRIAAIDSRSWIEFLQRVLPEIDTLDPFSLSEREKRMLQMFYITVWQKAADWGSEETEYNLRALKNSPTMLAELLELLSYRYERIDFLDQPLRLGFDCPLDLHCTYTRDQILVALDYMTPSNVREGVKWLPEKQTDVFFVTLNKSDKDYSPTTMYEDYSINSELFHWQSQSTTAENSATGQRYIHHRRGGSRVLLFVREFKQDNLGTAPYTCLGPVHYVSHTGSRPMNITWRLESPIPAKYLKKTNKLVVG